MTVEIAHNIDCGTVVIGSDAHVWPGPWTCGMLAFLYVVAELQPAGVILNGDVFDGASISRFPSIGWENKPTIAQELEACKEFVNDIAEVSPDAWHDWPLGNHDLRYETRLANEIPEYAGIFGMHLKDHMAAWSPCWSVDLNHGQAWVKHRKSGGVHAAYNNTLRTGVTMVTGHTHQLSVSRWDDRRGTRWGIEDGFLADPAGPQFVHYTENDRGNWHVGFAVLTFVGGRLLPPELVYVDPEARTYDFRGERRSL